MISEKDKNWSCHRTALGEKTEKREINVAANEGSSSLLKPIESHKDFDKYNKTVRTETVNIVSFDEFVKNEKVDLENKNSFLKIDVQGYEEDVLKGALNCIGQISLVQLEISLVHLYEGESNMLNLIQWMELKGFTVYQIFPFYWDFDTGRLNQIDVLFVRADLIQ